ncbi:MAG: O-antigen ligase family protein [Bacilli bacterium]|nr:O-antigen ligase family protein [Bacilli bacterium]
MEKTIQKNMSLYIKIWILIQPLIDLITGVFVHNNINFTIGILIRVIALLCLMVITVFIYKKKSALYVYLALSIYCILYLIGIILYKDGGLFKELQGLLKVIYFPVLLYSLYCIKDDIKIESNTLYTTFIIYILCIFIPTIFDIGYKTYEVTKSGSLGFFNSANEVGGIISILTPILFIKLKEKKHLFLQIAFLGIYLVTILNMGTKTPLLSLLITIAGVFVYLILDSIKKKNYKLLTGFITTVIVLVTAVIVLLPKTNFYKNIRVHLDYLGVDHITDVFQEFNLVDHFIFSQRLTFLSDEKYLYDQCGIYQKIVGRGYLDNGLDTKMIEMDYFDIYFHHGPLGFLLVFGIYGYVLWNLIKSRGKYSFERLMIYISSFLVLILSLFSGHIIIAPSVNIIVVSVFLLISQKNTKKA